jgi:hypothetical protein
MLTQVAFSLVKQKQKRLLKLKERKVHEFVFAFLISFSLLAFIYQHLLNVWPALQKELWPKKLEANFEHFWLVVWPQVTNKCYTTLTSGYY